MPTWIRVRDTTTGHEFDVEAHAFPSMAGAVEIPGYPHRSGPGARPRPAKHHTDKAGRPAPRRTRKPQPPAAQPADIEGEAP
jgi:hypothetical protein